jgi:uncharacterized protein involved in type VI secretion and phage assembly
MLGPEYERLLVDMHERMTTRFYGKHRGIVTNVDDPDKLGRIKAKVDSVYAGKETEWAVPAVPFAGAKHGLLLLPETGDGVWIEFEAGIVSRPIWTGFWWGNNDLPSPNGPHKRVLTTPKGLQMVFDDDSTTLQLKHPGGGEITMKDSSITIKLGSSSIELSLSGVSVNNGALQVK